jgi:thioesterase domain-containing protein
MNPTRTATLLMAAVLCGALCAASAPASGDPLPSAESPSAGGGATTKMRGRVYLFRGFAGVFFSRGTDKLAERIERAGFYTAVNEAMMCSSIAKEAVSDYRRDPAPIVLIGHSVGGACAISFAATLNDENIRVSLLITTDPPRITGDVPTNVERFINIFQSNSLLGGVDVDPAQGFHGHYASYNLVEHAEITHVNMEKTETVQDQLVTKIQQLPTLPKSEGETVPIRYVVPADAAIELWDSGMPVFARAQDTLATLAALYHVPPWSIAQINKAPEGATLTAGQRIVVPRRLTPPPAPGDRALSAQAPPKR